MDGPLLELHTLSPVAQSYALLVSTIGVTHVRCHLVETQETRVIILMPYNSIH